MCLFSGELELCGFQQVKAVNCNTAAYSEPSSPSFMVALLPELSGTFLSMASIISAYGRTCVLGVNKSYTGTLVSAEGSGNLSQVRALSDDWGSRDRISHCRLNCHVFNIDLPAPAEPIAQAFADKAFQGREWEDGCNTGAVADL